ncbi:hypothetical protein [Eikenella sp. Marseille-P7795]|uniref:hypothetical protein n=1 Tax=Eikenella sp. Marseille-P7795 TaxID=2866577 RepID=UPI001CE414E3|nr:hypothetical protein [Eikenella sp. Marseille-P7795]
MKRMIACGLFVLCICMPALANMVPHTVFSCTTEQGNQVEVARVGSVYRYSFGREGQPPQLVFINTRQQVIAQSPRGRYAGWRKWMAMVLVDKGYRYRVYSLLDGTRNEEYHRVPGSKQYDAYVLSNEKNIPYELVRGVEVWKGPHRLLRSEICSERYTMQVMFDEEFTSQGYNNRLFFDE